MPREAWVLVKAVVSDTYPDIGLPGPQPPFPGGPVDPGYSPPWAQPRPPQPGWPTVPGWPGGSLPGGAGGFPHPDQGLPGSQPRPDHGLPPFPSHPIYIPVPVPPDSGLEPTHPIYIPVYPDIGFPADQPRPDNTLPGPQPYPDNTLPGLGGSKAAIIAKIKKAVEFWTGNLPPTTGTEPAPTPV